VAPCAGLEPATDRLNSRLLLTGRDSDRPPIIYIVEGAITEFASNCPCPIVHKGGERETSATSPRRLRICARRLRLMVTLRGKNIGHSAVTLLSADVLHDERDHNM
jgi:hypothetical protein